MNTRPSIPGYDNVAIAFHWGTAILVLCAFVMGPGGSEQRVYSSAKDFDRQIHELLGLTVFSLTWLRLAWRAFAPPPAQHASLLWMARLSRAVQLLLYALLVAAPITAVAGAWLEGHPLTLGVLGNIPPPFPEMRTVGKTLSEIHPFLGDTIMWVAGFHAVAGLFHHFVLKDAVLVSMIPPRWRDRVHVRSRIAGA